MAVLRPVVAVGVMKTEDSTADDVDKQAQNVYCGVYDG